MHKLFHRGSCTQKTFTERCFHTEMASHTHTQRNTFSLSHTRGHTFTQRWFYTEQLYTQIPLQNRGAFTKEWVYTRSFYIRMFFTQAYSCMISDGGHACRATSVQQADVKRQFHRSFWRLRRSSWERVGPAQARIAFFFWQSRFRARGLRFMDINPRRAAAWRENWESFWTCRLVKWIQPTSKE